MFLFGLTISHVFMQGVGAARMTPHMTCPSPNLVKSVIMHCLIQLILTFVQVCMCVGGESALQNFYTSYPQIEWRALNCLNVLLVRDKYYYCKLIARNCVVREYLCFHLSCSLVTMTRVKSRL